MKRILGRVALASLALTATGALTVYARSEAILRRRYEPVPEPLPPAPPALVADGHRLARLHGCLSCHGEGLAGNDVFDAPPMGDIIAPNLPRLARTRTDAQLAVAIRQGIAPDGRGLLVMTSAVHARMLPEETAALIAWIRTLPVTDGESRPFRLRPIGRLQLALGAFRLQPDAVREYRDRMPVDLGPSHALGRRLASAICAECHGADLAGGPAPMADFNARFGGEGKAPPSLDIVAAYDLEKFRRLMRTGTPLDGRELWLMGDVARKDLSRFTDAEIDAIHAYLVARAAHVRADGPR